MKLTATVSNCSVYPRPEKPLIMHVTGNMDGAADVTEAADLVDFVKANPGIGFVNVYDSRFPRKPVAWDTFVKKHANKLWPKIREQLAAV